MIQTSSLKNPVRTIILVLFLAAILRSGSISAGMATLGDDLLVSVPQQDVTTPPTANAIVFPSDWARIKTATPQPTIASLG